MRLSPWGWAITQAWSTHSSPPLFWHTKRIINHKRGSLGDWVRHTVLTKTLAYLQLGTEFPWCGYCRSAKCRLTAIKKRASGSGRFMCVKKKAERPVPVISPSVLRVQLDPTLFQPPLPGPGQETRYGSFYRQMCSPAFDLQRHFYMYFTFKHSQQRIHLHRLYTCSYCINADSV